MPGGAGCRNTGTPRSTAVAQSSSIRGSSSNSCSPWPTSVPTYAATSPSSPTALPQLCCRRCRILHRQLRRSPETLRMAGDERGHLVVVPASELGCDRRLYVVKVGERVRGQHLPADPQGVHGLDPCSQVHECASPVPHTLERVATHAERRADRIVDEFGPVFAGAPEHALEHHMRMQVQQGDRLLQPNSTG